MKSLTVQPRLRALVLYIGSALFMATCAVKSPINHSCARRMRLPVGEYESESAVQSWNNLPGKWQPLCLVWLRVRHQPKHRVRMLECPLR